MDTLWQIDDEAGTRFEHGANKGAWYEVLGALQIETMPELKAEESVSSWDYLLRELPHPGCRLFHGDKHTAQDGFDDPNVSFIGVGLVKEISAFLVDNQEAIRTAFEREGYPENMWLYHPLTAFFADAAANNKAIIALWDGETSW